GTQARAGVFVEGLRASTTLHARRHQVGDLTSITGLAVAVESGSRSQILAPIDKLRREKRRISASTSMAFAMPCVVGHRDTMFGGVLHAEHDDATAGPGLSFTLTRASWARGGQPAPRRLFSPGLQPRPHMARPDSQQSTTPTWW